MQTVTKENKQLRENVLTFRFTACVTISSPNNTGRSYKYPERGCVPHLKGEQKKQQMHSLWVYKLSID